MISARFTIKMLDINGSNQSVNVLQKVISYRVYMMHSIKWLQKACVFLHTSYNSTIPLPTWDMRHSSDMLAWYTFKQHDQEPHEHSGEHCFERFRLLENLQFLPFVLSFLSWWWTRLFDSEVRFKDIFCFYSTWKVNMQQSKCKCKVIPIRIADAKIWPPEMFFLFEW
jgi:hypothetical protein